MPDADTIDLVSPSQGVGEAVETIADNAIGPFDDRCCEGLRELISP
jgi:hypothetical protein